MSFLPVSNFRSLVWSLVFVFCLSGQAEDDLLHLSCTTSHLACVSQAIGGAHVDVTTIIPFGMCPGHFDLNPREAQALANADLVLCHGFERFLDDVRAAQPEIRITRVAVRGNWMIPEVQKTAARTLTEVLCEQLPAYAAMFRKNHEEYCRKIDVAARGQMQDLTRMKETRVACSSMNQDLVEALGFKVIVAFPRDEDISAKVLVELVTRARSDGVRLVIDNRQSSGKVGRTFAVELGVPVVVLTNFPPENAGAEGYFMALSQNTGALVEAAGR